MQSFKTLYRQHYGFVWATVRRHGVAPMLVEDAVHDTFVVAYRRLDAFDGRRPRAWLYSIGRRVASSYRRTEGRRDVRHRSAADVAPVRADLESTVGAKATLQRFLDGLTPEDRELFVLSEVDGLTGPELAATLGRKLPTVYSRVRILRQRFEASVGGEARETRPAASARGWMLLQPWLAAPAAAAVPVGAVLGVVGLLVGAAVVGVAATADNAVVARPALATAMAPVSPAAAKTPESQTPAPQPLAPTLVVEPSAESAPSPSTVRTAPRRRSGSRSDAKPATTAAPAEPALDLAADTRLLREAKLAVRSGDARTAIAKLEAHERRFPKPAQPDLRVALWVESLCAVGRDEDARRRARALAGTRPSSPVLGRLEGLCTGPRETW
ncbi:MAG: sigma-70 family RNA polymerase sigma factor [Myxococcota bacterium]